MIYRFLILAPMNPAEHGASGDLDMERLAADLAAFQRSTKDRRLVVWARGRERDVRSAIKRGQRYKDNLRRLESGGCTLNQLPGFGEKYDVAGLAVSYHDITLGSSTIHLSRHHEFAGSKDAVHNVNRACDAGQEDRHGDTGLLTPSGHTLKLASKL